MKLKRLISLLLCLVMLVPMLASCQDPAPCEHTDTDGDGKCDACGEAMGTDSTCTTHIDADSDGKCDNCGEATDPPPTGQTRYTVKVETVAGMPLEGVTVYVHNSDGYSICAYPAQTDKNGVAVFDLETSDQYSIQLDGVPKGYNVKTGETKADRYPMLETGATIMLSSAPIKGGSFAESYEIGDIMHDFTLSDVNGKEYNLSSLLAEKKMVMLNFWYVECSWCLKEFPGINGAYKNYKDDIEVLAINDYGDSFNNIVKFPTTGTFEGEENNLVFPFFKVEKNTNNLIVNKFANTGYPTTVIIDRYGVICFIEAGAIIGQSKWDQIFAHFTAEDYDQKLITNAEDLTPPVAPNIEWGGSDQIAGSFNGSDILVDYAPETDPKDAPYSWPFIPTTLGANGEIKAVRPSNTYDNSYAILYANVQLKPGQAVIFDYFSSCEYGKDNLIVLVDKKDICTLTGVNTGSKSDLTAWETCCAYVDPRPVTSTNKDELATYSVAFVYQKDSDTSEGDDTVYLRNLRVVPAQEIPTETYIFRYAATDLNSDKTGYNTYVQFVLHTDGFYHVLNADNSVGPLLLVNFLGYTNFDSKQTMSQRISSAEQFLVDGKDAYNTWMVYANASSNSKINGYTPVTEELKKILDAYCETYRMQAGKSYHENLWLQLCIYYDAYGLDAEGNPAKPIENPILGLTTFSPFEVELNDPAAGDKVTATFKYDAPIMPRGYLYRFVPSKSGVYRVTSFSNQEVTGWIFTGSSYDWTANNQERTVLANSEVEERFCPELHITDKNGNIVRDYLNVSLVTYMEAGKEYFIDIAYYDLYAVGEFEFEVKYVGERFDAFVMASPGPVTFIENASGGIGQLIALGIDYEFVVDEADGIQYAYQVIERNADGTVKTLGEKIYADFHYPTISFPTQSIVELAALGAFDFSLSQLDVDAISHWSYIRKSGKTEIIAKWISEGNLNAEALWNSKNLDTILELVQKKGDTSAYPAADVAIARDALQEGIYILKADWGKDSVDADEWTELDMDKALRGTYSSKEDVKQKQLDIIAGIDQLWNEAYKMDEVAVGTYHGEGRDMTDVINKYIALMETDAAAGERQGCVAVTRELSELLSDLFSKYVFDEVAHDWLKFCFYYDRLGLLPQA